MKTVKEVSQLTGISVRALHYYDEIGLFPPTAVSEGGYRLYDDKAMEVLQQILFFREFDIPLREIKAIMTDPALDRDRVLQMQRRMLAARKARMERLIAGIDAILKGEAMMDYTGFNKSELGELFRQMTRRMPANIREAALAEFGSMEQWERHYIASLSDPRAQEHYAKMVRWDGEKAEQNAPPGQQIAGSYLRRVEGILQRLAEKRDCPPDSFAVRELVGEYGFVIKRFCQAEDEKALMLAQARSFAARQADIDRTYGPGAAAFFDRAIGQFYEEKGAQS